MKGAVHHEHTFSGRGFSFEGEWDRYPCDDMGRMGSDSSPAGNKPACFHYVLFSDFEGKGHRDRTGGRGKVGEK